MPDLKWDLLPKETRLQIRGAMIEEMVRVLSENEPENPDVRKKACKLVNLAISRERLKQQASRKALLN
jgi:hypothetical protein